MDMSPNGLFWMVFMEVVVSVSHYDWADFGSGFHFGGSGILSILYLDRGEEQENFS